MTKLIELLVSVLGDVTSACIKLLSVGMTNSTYIKSIIIHQTHYEKSDWSRAFNQFTIACELDMINVISAADITFNVCLVTKLLGVFSSGTKWLTLRFCF